MGISKEIWEVVVAVVIVVMVMGGSLMENYFFWSGVVINAIAVCTFTAGIIFGIKTRLEDRAEQKRKENVVEVVENEAN